jgi:hypothetical protein
MRERRHLLGSTWLVCLIYAALAQTADADEASVIDIGSRRQLFVDRHLLESLENVRQVLHHPVRRGIAIRPELLWEKYGVSYMVAFKDADRYRAWYRVDAADLSSEDARHTLTAYAESADGIHWEKPKLGILEFNGSKDNNLVWGGPGNNMAVFKDGNPDAPPAERYKALVAQGIHGLVSADGLHWRLLQAEPILTPGPFDSHNIAFWDHETRQYVAYTRGVRLDGRLGDGMESRFKGGVRWVRRATSRDFRHWTKLEPIQTGDAPREEFYTNAAVRYERAPDYLLMFPSRFASAREPIPGWKFGKGVNDIAFLSSRDGVHFDRTFLEAFVRPGLDPGNWHERSLYMERGILQTAPDELSMYAMEHWRLDTVHIRRLTLRPDGFVSLQGPYDGGEVVTRPLRFSGERLRLNVSTSAVGSVRVEIQDERSQPLKDFALDNCREIFGDELDRKVQWKSTATLGELAGKTVRLRFALRDADLYAFRFDAGTTDAP